MAELPPQSRCEKTVLRALGAYPEGATIPQLADDLHVHHNTLYRVLPKLHADGKVLKIGRVWRVLYD